MTNWAVQPIETFDVLKSAAQAVCYVCDLDNCLEDGACRQCGAPLALSLQAQASRTKPQLVAVVSTPGAGKTVYLGLLTDMLARQQGCLQVLARGAFSVSLQQTTMDALAHHRFPDPTPRQPDGWNWFHCEISGLARRGRVDLVLPDVAGEVLQAEFERPTSVPAIQRFLEKCAAAIVLVDLAQLEDGDPDADFAATKIVNYLAELLPESKQGWAKRPVAVVFSKADRNESCFDDPAYYGEQMTPGLWRQCQERLARHRFFATAAVGASIAVGRGAAKRHVPLRVEPRGVAEPFQWLVDQLT